jgi:MYB-related transcription factor LHY
LSLRKYQHIIPKSENILKLISYLFQLEKEALVKGVPVGQALDIEIPPPRPKRKPCNPYPRKISNGCSTSQVGLKDEKSEPAISSLSQAKQVLDLEKEPIPEVLLFSFFANFD